MKTYMFDAHRNNAPAYGCNEPGDNSGYYFRVADILPLVSAVEKILDAHNFSSVAWEAMRDAENFLKTMRESNSQCKE